MSRPLSPRIVGAIESYIRGDIKPVEGNCPHCHKPIEHSGAAISRSAKPGDIGICSSCIGLYWFGPDLVRRVLSESDLAYLPPRFRRELADAQTALREAHALKPS
jgi:hypothetical protein